MKYIAYGSNMNLAQMAIRCPGAKIIATGTLRGYQLEFNVHATIVEIKDPNVSVPVAVWEITPEHEQRLDLYEGFPRYYRKIECIVDIKGIVDIGDGVNIRGLAYQMNHFDYAWPAKDYFKGILDAYESLGLRSEIKRALLPALMRSHRLFRR